MYQNKVSVLGLYQLNLDNKTEKRPKSRRKTQNKTTKTHKKYKTINEKKKKRKRKRSKERKKNIYTLESGINVALRLLFFDFFPGATALFRTS